MSDQHLSHDPAYKQFFSTPEMVASLLQDFVTEDFIRELDFSTLEQCSGSYVTDDLRERHDDIVWRLRWKDSWCYLYLLLEFQRNTDPWMAVRILAYTALLWQDLIKSGAVTAGQTLPPVLPVVIYNGGRKWTAARDVTELLPPLSGSLLRYQPKQKYFLLDESQVPAEKLQTGGLATQLVRLERGATLDDIRAVVKELAEQLQGPEYLQLRRVFSAWLGRILFKRAGIAQHIPEFQDLQEVDAMLEERAAQWKDEFIQQGVLLGRAEGIAEGWAGGIAEGRAEGLTEGKVQGIRLTLYDILQMRFGTLPESLLIHLSAIQDADDLRALTLFASQANSLQAFTEHLQQSMQ